MTTKSRAKAHSVPSYTPSIRDRIVGLRRIRASDLVPSDHNIHKHSDAQKRLLESIIRTLGFAGAELTVTLPDGRLQLIDGHLRQDIAGDALIPVLETDLTLDEADQILATYDPIQRLAVYDQQNVAELTAMLERSNSDAAALLAAAAQQDAGPDLIRQYEEQKRVLLGEPWRPDTGRTEHANDAGDDQESDDGGDEDEDEELYAQAYLWDGDEEALAAHRQWEKGTGPTVYDDEAIISSAVAHYRATGFPYRDLPVYISMQRINKLARMPLSQLARTYVGSDVADTYHPHRFHGHAANMKSPVEAFAEDKLLRKAISLRLAGVGAVEQGYLPAMSVVTGTQACYNFRPGFAAHLYRTFAQPGDTVLDTSTGYGGRLVGFMASGLVTTDEETGETRGRYIGIDPNTATHNGNLRMADELGFTDSVELYPCPAEDVDPELLANRCDFALTSPPYFTRERYSDEDTQSWKRYGHDKTGETWRDGFLRPMLRLTYAALKPGKTAVLNVDDVTVDGVRIPLIDWTREDAIDAGFEYVETRYFEFASSAMGAGHDPGVAGSEPVLVFKKPHAGPSDQMPLPPVEPQSFLAWMTRLYHVTADLDRFHGDIGVWPEEMRDYVEMACLAHSTGPTRFTSASNLLLASPEKPSRPGTCLLLLSGGKDSVAMGMAAEAQGYTVHAVHVRHVNKAYRHEVTASRKIARTFGWRFNLIAPRGLPDTLGVSVIRDQYLMALALDRLPYAPDVIALGNYGLVDGATGAFLMGMETAFAACDPVLAFSTNGATKRLTPLADEISVFSAWLDAPAEVRDATSSCLTLPHNQVMHRERLTSRYGYTPPPLECGACEKCRVKAVTLHRHFAHEYPEAYLEECRKTLRETLSRHLPWSHQHDKLVLPDIDTRAHQCLEILGFSDSLPTPKPPSYPVTITADTQPALTLTNDPRSLTPVQRITSATISLKRDDLFVAPGTTGVNGAVGRDVYTFLTIAASRGAAGVSTCGGSHSSQIMATAAIAASLGMAARIFVPNLTRDSDEIAFARAHGAEIIGVRMGYPRTVKRRAQDDAASRENWVYLPYAHEVAEAIDNSAAQAANIPDECTRVVFAVGCGMTLCGAAVGLWERSQATGRPVIPVLGVIIGSMRSAQENVARWIPDGMRPYVTLIDGTKGKAGAHDATDQTEWWDVSLDHYFEAKVAPWIEPGDCFWIMSNSDAVVTAWCEGGAS